MNVLSTLKWMKWKGVKLVEKEIKTRELIFPFSRRHGSKFSLTIFFREKKKK